MPKRADLFLTITIASAMMITGCSDSDWREGVEDQVACVERAARWGEDLSTQPAAAKFIWRPTFTYDVSLMEQSDLDEFLASSRASRENDRTQILVRSGEGIALQKIEGQPVPIANGAAAGCALQRSDMRLVSIEFVPPQPKSGGEVSDLNRDHDSGKEQ